MESAKKTREELLQEVTALRKKVQNLERDGQAVQAWETRYRELAECLPQIVFELDKKGRFTFFNRHITTFLGYDQEDFSKGLTAWDAVIPEDRERMKREIDLVLKGKSKAKGTETALVRKDGTSFPVTLFASPIVSAGGITGLRGVGVDISHQKKAEIQLRESEERYRSIVEHTHDGICVIDENARIVYGNDELSRMTGYSREENLGKEFIDFIVPEDRALAMERYSRRRRGENVVNQYEARLVCKDGRQIIVEAKISVLKDSGGKQRSVVKLLDITDRKKVEDNLRQSENLYRTIFENTGTVMMIADEDRNIILLNGEFERVAGIKREDVVGKIRGDDLIESADLERLIDLQRELLADPAKGPFHTEFALKDRTGRMRDVFLVISAIPETRLVVCSILDITERKQAVNALLEREKALQDTTMRLEEVNEALRVLLKHKQESQGEVESKVLANVRELVLPYVKKLQITSLDGPQKAYVDIIETNLEDIMSPFLRTLTSQYLNFTPKEIQVANYIRSGKTTKEIARIMSVSRSAIDLHRNHIRAKLGLNKKKANLRTHLASLA
ncbi:MAG: PAS domain S-box protein [Syntrophaceae bacterium]|nr:PAS domain S-box protein [Syntrophaceae bacterium]